jgi:hypothetical protein
VQFAQAISLVMLAAGMLIGGVYLTLGFDRDPSSATASRATNVYGSFGMPVASPVSVVLPRELVLVTNTPQPTETPVPTATWNPTVPTPFPTSVAIDICGPWITKGTECIMNTFPPTPIPPCPLGPNQHCIWTGRAEDASPIVPTPTITAGPVQ